MKILLTSIGTRGDMEPFLAIGRILKDKGHDITCLFPEQFRAHAEQEGFHFETLGPEFMEMLGSELGKFALGGGGAVLKKYYAFFKLAKWQSRNNKIMVRKQFDTINKLDPDRIIHNGKALVPVIWEVNHPGKTIFISPVPYLHYVKGHTHTAFHSNYGTLLNKMTYRLAQWGTGKAIMDVVKWLNIEGVSKPQVQYILKHQRVIYTISPQLFQRPNYWPDNLQVLGYYERDKTTDWQPDEALLSFLAQHEKMVFVTFGSMTNPHPKEKTRLILDILERNQIPAIINTSSGGLQKPGSYDKTLFHFVSQIPYDWIFPKMYAVIHHGGSGTIHMVAKYGCASLIIPHIIDQFCWNEIASEKGLGPKGVKIGKITIANVEPKIVDLWKNRIYKENAQEIAAKMKSEKVLDARLYEEIVR